MSRHSSAESVWSQCRAPQSTDLWQKYRDHPTIRLRDRLFKLNYKLALSVAHKASRQCQEPLEDLQQIACEGLLRAIDRFDPTQGVAFSSFAVPYIKGEIGHFLRDHWSHLKIPRRSVEFIQKVQRTQRHFANAGREVSEETIAVSILLKGKGKFVTAELKAAATAKWQQISNEVDRAALVPLEDAFHCATPEEEVDREVAAAAFEGLHSLPHQQRTCIIESVFGHLTDEAIAASQGTTATEVRLTIQDGLTRLRTGLEGKRQNG